jgi:hypothetical protein
MAAFFSPHFAKYLLHAELVRYAYCLPIVRPVLMIMCLLVVFLPLLFVAYCYRLYNQQLLIEQLINVKEKMLLYPFTVALAFIYSTS